MLGIMITKTNLKWSHCHHLWPINTIIAILTYGQHLHKEQKEELYKAFINENEWNKMKYNWKPMLE